jgi:hypothetical protein
MAHRRPAVVAAIGPLSDRKPTFSVAKPQSHLTPARSGLNFSEYQIARLRPEGHRLTEIASSLFVQSSK